MRLRAGIALSITWLVLATSIGRPLNAGTRLHIEGDAPPIVVFEAGLGDGGEVWRKVQDAVARGCARTVTYSRAGYQTGTFARGSRDAEHVVAELREQLAAAGLAPPYVLVGHSLGGLFVQYFARRHPEEVSGLVLVDSTHWNQLARIKEEASASYRMIRVASLGMQGAMRGEFKASPASGRQVVNLPPTSVPTIVLSSTRARMGEGEAFRTLSATLQREIAAQYATVRHEYVKGATHYIQKDRPEVVTQAARELAGCAQAAGGPDNSPH